MCRMNIAGAAFADIDGVKAMTDVTGFGLLGHLSEMCQAQAFRPGRPGVFLSSLALKNTSSGRSTGGTQRNFASYGHLMGEMPPVRDPLCDPQTSGGLLLAVTPEAEAEVKAAAAQFGLISPPLVS
ncbi:AIR synthase-related protein [Shigella flexneri]